MKNILCLFILITSNILCDDDNLNENDVNIPLLNKALSIPTSGGSLAYYSLNVNGQKTKGERSWQERWNIIKKAINYENKKILDLGCNTGLCGVYLLKFAKAHSVVGVDRPDNDLSTNGIPRLIESANLLQKAFNVSFKIIQTDLNTQNYEEIIGTNYDIVFCMSILKWVNNKERFLKYLSNFKNIIFEGHESDEIEIKRFKRLGYNYKILGTTQVGLSYSTDSIRTLIHFYK